MNNAGLENERTWAFSEGGGRLGWLGRAANNDVGGGGGGGSPTTSGDRGDTSGVAKERESLWRGVVSQWCSPAAGGRWRKGHCGR
ncbi:hypothetical protein NL676_038543 [Syzygium grande]|nr:hypothetical protein NL676_038543 [Syzygium grande]